jgi:gliding motility-associated-like protein
VLASASFQVNVRGKGLELAGYHFSPPGATMVLQATGPPPEAGAVFPVQVSADGAWKTVGTASYSPLTGAYVFTVYQTGLYRMGADPAGGLSSVVQSVHPRVFSPNGDGYNDVVHFDLTSPDGEPASGEIFDLHAAKVAALAPSPLGLQWDGRGPGGRVVPGGVYLYQIHLGRQRVTGSVVVVK